MSEQSPRDPSRQPFGPPDGQPVYYGGYSPPGWQPRRKKRHTVRIFFITLGAVMVIATVGLAIAGAIVSSDAPAAEVTVTPFPTPSAVATTSVTARIGSAIVLAGNNPGEKMAVTVVKVLGHAQGATEFDTAQQGDRLYAVQFRLDDTGSIAYADGPSNGAAVVDSAGQSYQASLDDVADCVSFPATENISPGNSGLGCIAFSVPVKARITMVQFTLDSGLGPQTGQWKVRG